MKLLRCEKFGLVGPHGLMFEPLSFQLNYGEIKGLVGANGAGKSLLLKTFANRVAPLPFRQTGALEWNGNHAKQNVYFLPQLQAPELHMPYKLGEIASLDGKSLPNVSWFDHSLAARTWNQASGGEKMRALLARAFASEAQLLLLDEPFNHLDSCSVSALRLAMQDYVAEQGDRAIVFVSHLESSSEGLSISSGPSFPTLRIHPLNLNSGSPL